MPTATCFVDETPPSSNTNTGVGGRGNPKGIARTKGKWEGMFAVMLLTAKLPRNLSRVRVRPRLEFKTPNRRDSDNFYFAISKPLGDALTKGGWLPDDTPEFYACERPEIEVGVKTLPPMAKGRLTLDIEYE